ncbi:MAG TPA: hypothetical protein VHT29_13665 [Solirubrobacteraceae bacterium]|jgi:hypothetical protein|nr:hypothetical protein [Solirubrobacteraceae bacterium]
MPDSSVLVLDTLAGTLIDMRLVAHIAADEPPENAQRITAMYLEDPTRGRCRALTEAELDTLCTVEETPAQHLPLPDETGLDLDGCRLEIRVIAGKRAAPTLRWVQISAGGLPSVVTLREVLAQTQSYEPVLALTRAALAVPDPGVSTSTLQLELKRLQDSPIVLNRGVREAVQRALASGETTLSEIALRCGRIKRDSSGNVSGETSWLTRRAGLIREHAGRTPGVWIHSDVLALIARDGLSLDPREVEL